LWGSTATYSNKDQRPPCFNKKVYLCGMYMKRRTDIVSLKVWWTMSTHFPSWNHCSLFQIRRICKICEKFHCKYTLILIADRCQYGGSICSHDGLPIRYIHEKIMKGLLGYSVGRAPVQLLSPLSTHGDEVVLSRVWGTIPPSLRHSHILSSSSAYLSDSQWLKEFLWWI